MKACFPFHLKQFILNENYFLGFIFNFVNIHVLQCNEFLGWHENICNAKLYINWWCSGIVGDW